MRFTPLAFALVLAFGCGGNDPGLGPGETCVRSFECAPGLACVMGVCNGDPTAIGGMVPSADAGVAADMAMAADLGPQPDMGPPPDLGMPVDMFTPPVDMFTPPVDMFTPEPDMFTEPDMFVPEPDMFVPPPDMG